MAFQLENGKILRVSTRRDPAYQAFLRLTLQRQDNPFYPRVFAAGFYPDNQMVVREKLKPLSPEHITKYERFLEKLNRVHTTVMVRAPASKFDSAIKKLLFCRKVRQAYPPHKQAFRQLVADLRWLAKQHDFDLHGKNVMVRPCEKLVGGQIVVIDPVC